MDNSIIIILILSAVLIGIFAWLFMKLSGDTKEDKSKTSQKSGSSKKGQDLKFLGNVNSKENVNQANARNTSSSSPTPSSNKSKKENKGILSEEEQLKIVKKINEERKKVDEQRRVQREKRLQDMKIAENEKLQLDRALKSEDKAKENDNYQIKKLNEHKSTTSDSNKQQGLKAKKTVVSNKQHNKEEMKRQEAKKLEEEKKVQKAKQLQEEKKLQETKKIEEEKRIQEAKKLEEEKRIQEAKKLEEEKRIQEAKKLEEEKRIQEAKKLEEEKNKAKEPIKILIVDDAKFMRIIIKKILLEAGYNIVGESETGRDAIKLSKELNPDIITMDITMPDINGLDAVKEILIDQPDMKIIMLSADDHSETVNDSLKAGALDFITKPFEKDKVLSIIEKVIKNKHYVKR